MDITPLALSCTCLKKAEREEAVILRVFNSSRNTVSNGRIKLGKNFQHAMITNMNEQCVEDEELKITEGICDLPPIRSDQVITLKLIAGKERK